MENQTSQTKTLKSIVKEILNNAASDVIYCCFFGNEGIEPYHGKFYHEGQEDTYNTLQEAGITTKRIDRYGGEGKGDDYWSVYEFSNGNELVYVQFDGWYDSYDGSDFNEWFFVEPKEVKVVEFHRCK